jgi:hypothetical protein
MAGLFGQALAAFQGFFSRGFWFGSFLPVAMFAAVNLILAWIASFVSSQRAIDDLQAKDWVWAAPIAAGLIVLAYALAPLVPVCRAILDGRRLPVVLFEWLRGEAFTRKNKALTRLMRTGQYPEHTKLLRSVVALRLNVVGLVPAPGVLRPLLVVLLRASGIWFIWPASLAVRFLEARVASGNLPSDPTIDLVVTLAFAAINLNAGSNSSTLQGLETRIRDALDKADENARDRYRRLQEHYNKLPRDAQPTLAGEARNLSELYSQSVYNVEFSFLWPRVQMVIPEKDAATQRIESARSLADFSVLSLMLAVATLTFWLPTLAITQTRPWSFLALGLSGPIVVRFFYQLVVESQISLGEVAQGIVDRFRFEVLKTLHIRPPPTLAAERELWSALAAIARGQSPDADIVWTAPAAPKPTP